MQTHLYLALVLGEETMNRKLRTSSLDNGVLGWQAFSLKTTKDESGKIMRPCNTLSEVIT